MSYEDGAFHFGFGIADFGLCRYLMRIVWVTDIHLNFVPCPASRKRFFKQILVEKPDIVLVGGDIGQAGSVIAYLREMEAELALPIYFVLGNHDFYSGSIQKVREKVSDLCRQSHLLRWLSVAGVVPLTDKTCLTGHDAWGDGRFGDYERSEVILNDAYLIVELKDISKAERRRRMQELGDEAAHHFRTWLPKAVKAYQEIIVLTHVPLFKEAAWHRGRRSDDEWLPFFSCKAAGEVLIEIMKENPGCHLTALCAHTHSGGIATVLPNLVAITGNASYGKPKIQRVFDVE